MQYLVSLKLDHISEVDMYLFFEKGMRGGVSYIYKKYIKGKNKYLTSYDPKKPTKYITYSHKSNLFCYAMSKSLPAGGFMWFDSANFNIDKYDYDSFRGCVLEVNLDYFK